MSSGTSGLQLNAVLIDQGVAGSKCGTCNVNPQP
jgi:hypothetical protein